MLICKLSSASTLPAMSICDNLQEILKTLKLYKTKTWHLYKYYVMVGQTYQRKRKASG